MFFVLSTGRAGSRTISNVVSQSPDALCVHEPVPYLIEECAAWRYGELATEDLVAMLRETRPRQIDGRQYGESANRLSLAVPALAEAFPDARFVWLQRDGREVVASGHQRGWYDAEVVADTPWERHRLRADRLGEMTEDEWVDLTPFEKNCWLWRRTNELIETDLAALDPQRWTTVRLDSLGQSLDQLADFLDISPVAWTVPHLNARTSTPGIADTRANTVDRVRSHHEWDDAQHAGFDKECGELMDRLQPDWRTTTTEPSAPTTDAELDEIRSGIADLAVIRGELGQAIANQARVQRRNAVLQTERNEAVESARAAKRTNSDLERRLAGVESELAAAEQQASMETTRLEAERLAEQTRADEAAALLTLIRTSTSYRLGHGVILVLKSPVLLARRVQLWLRKIRRRMLRRVARFARRLPFASAIGRRLPPRVKTWLSVPGSGGGRFGADFAEPGEHGWTSTRTGVRAVAGDRIDPAWGTAIDVHSFAAAAEEAPTHLDLVLTDGMTPPPAILDLAETHDAPVVDITGRLAPLRPGLLPMGFSRECESTFLVVSTRPDPVVPPLPPGRIGEHVDAADLPDPMLVPDDFRVFVQGHVGLVDHAALHRDPARRARVLVDVAACGLPVAVLDPETLEGHLPEPVLTAFAAVDPRDLVNDLRRERTSARQRRVVHAHASVRAVVDRLLVDAGRRGVRLPSLSALVASNRPSMIDNWARLLDAQDYPDLEVVACLHGDDFTEADEARARELLGDRISIHRVPADQTLGDALNTAVEHASGDVLVKWDDDDLYDTAHLADLIHAREYSGATLVGKAPEFTYLAGLDVTVRRLKTTAEGFSPTIGGPTLCIGRSDLRDIGGWRRSRRRVDSLLIEDVRAAGGTTYRTAGFGFVLMRAAAGRHSHTWAAGDDYFLSRSVDQRPGLDLEFAGITAPADVVERWSS